MIPPISTRNPALAPELAPTEQSPFRALLSDPDAPPVYVNRDFEREARRRGLQQPFRAWCLLRYLDQGNMGHFGYNEAVAALMACGWGRSSVYRLLRKGGGRLWVRDHWKKGHRPGLSLVGAERVAIVFHLQQVQARLHAVPLAIALPRSESTKGAGVAAWNAATFLLMLPAKRAPQYRFDFKRGLRIHEPRPLHPYARASIREDMGVPERSQRRYDRLRPSGHFDPQTKMRGRGWYVVARGPRNFAGYVDPGGIARVEPDLVGLEEDTMIARQLGHSFESTIERRGWGMAKRFNPRLRVRVGGGHQGRAPDGSTTNGKPRRFFDSFLSLHNGRRRMHTRPVAHKPLYLIPVGQGRPHPAGSPNPGFYRLWAEPNV